MKRIVLISHCDTPDANLIRYLLGKHHWANESEADREVLTPYGDSYNSVIVI